jgi:outer membrane protein TolC
VSNLEQIVESDVRTAYTEVQRAGEQVTATAASRKLQEAKLKSEAEKFRVGQSTTFLVAQAQRDLLSSQIDEVDAVVTYRKALVEIFRLEGSLLQRRGIAAPGATGPDAPQSAR